MSHKTPYRTSMQNFAQKHASLRACHGAFLVACHGACLGAFHIAFLRAFHGACLGACLPFRLVTHRLLCLTALLFLLTPLLPLLAPSLAMAHDAAFPFISNALPILTDNQTLTAIKLTLRVASLATVSSAVFGISVAWFVAHKRFYGRGIVDVLCALPLVLPPTVLGYYLIVLLGRRGIIGAWLADMGIQLMFSWQGAVVAATVVVFPLVYKSAKAAFESVDHTLEQAARTLGASELRIFFCISIPLAWRGIIAGVVLAFARGMGEFGATLMLAGNIVGQSQTLSLAIYDAFQAGDDAKATVLVLITSFLCMAVLLLAEYITRPKGARS